MRRAMGICGVVLGLTACAPPPQTPTRSARAELKTTAESVRGADYLIVTVPSLAAAVKPLVKHRESQGHRVHVLARNFPSAQAVRAAILAESEAGGGKLRFVLLLGDAAAPREDQAERLPTFYRKKLDYDADGARRAYATKFPTDAPFAALDGTRAAVGRVPARTLDEATGFVDKVIRYETQPISKAWPRRLVLRAGAAGFGGFTDAAIERSALNMLDDEVSYDFDLSVTFGKEESSYAAPPSTLGDQLVEEANAGALFFAYVGHSGATRMQSMTFRGWSYPHGGSDELERMNIPEGAPLFISLACDAGAFDLPYGEHSISEAAVLNPNGPIAAFAASRVSHPYPNLLYGEAFIGNFITKRPKTLGDGIQKLKEDMVAGHDMLGELLTQTNTDNLKEEHAGLYNLFGDPATRLRYPDPLDVSVASSPGEPLVVTVVAPIADGTVEVTLETKRSMIHLPLAPLEDTNELAVEATMTENHRRANDKLLQRAALEFSGSAQARLPRPEAPGRYVVKAFVLSRDGQRFAAGHHFVDIAP